MSLDRYTDQELMDELLNRRLDREEGEEGRVYCDDCKHFKCWTKRGEVPEDYNPCSKGHTMRFHMPEGWEDPHGGGYFRRVCSDRADRPPPAPPKPPEPPPAPLNGRPDWHQKKENP